MRLVKKKCIVADNNEQKDEEQHRKGIPCNSAYLASRAAREIGELVEPSGVTTGDVKPAATVLLAPVAFWVQIT